LKIWRVPIAWFTVISWSCPFQIDRS
jgi:hypothetical protein